jgi:hypothetical protein
MLFHLDIMFWHPQLLFGITIKGLYDINYFVYKVGWSQMMVESPNVVPFNL